jgi:hypothetical protein
MTIQGKLEKMLMENGMFESQAKEVMNLAKPNLEKLVENYHLDLNQNSDEYPTAIYSVLFLAIKPIALEWIEKNIPLAWYKPMFM